MPVRPLPVGANLEHLKHQAKDLLQALRRERAPGPASAGASALAARMALAQRLREFHPRFAGLSDEALPDAPFTLSDAQLTLAREYGFASWTRLKRRVEQPQKTDRLDLRHDERLPDGPFRNAVAKMDAGDVHGLRALLQVQPYLVRERASFEGGNYFQTPTLLEFVAENPIRHGTMPANVVDVARALLEAGAEPAAVQETLLLVSTGRVARECGVQHALIDLLCDAGANAGEAVRRAALLGEHGAVEALLQRGASIDLVVAAALGREAGFRALLANAGEQERQTALSVACDMGRVEMVRTLLDQGVALNRFNAVGAHSHTTPLHQAALGGWLEIVKLLIAHGADVSLRDALWQATPRGWAEHAGQTEVAAYLADVERAATESPGSPTK